METLKELILTQTANTLTQDLREEIVAKVTDRVFLSQVQEVSVWHVFPVAHIMELLTNHPHRQNDDFTQVIGVLGPKSVYEKYYVGLCDTYLHKHLLKQVEDDDVLIELNSFIAESRKSHFECQFDFTKCKGQVVVGVGRKNSNKPTL